MWVEGRLFSRGYIAQSRDWFNNRHDELRPAASFLLLYPWERTVACGLKPYLGRPGYPLSPLHTLVPHPTRRICHASACATYCLTLQVTSRRKQSCNIACVYVWRKRKHWVRHISIIVGDGVVHIHFDDFQCDCEDMFMKMLTCWCTCTPVYNCQCYLSCMFIVPICQSA